MEVVGSYLMDQVLKMQWLSDLVTMLVGAFGLDVNSQWGGTIHFLIYDTVKIVILLCVMIFIISYIQSYFPPERSKRILGRFKGIGGNINRLTVLANMGKVQVIGLEKAAGELSEVSAALRAVMEGR